MNADFWFLDWERNQRGPVGQEEIEGNCQIDWGGRNRA
jgi:hypothetical protein